MRDEVKHVFVFMRDEVKHVCFHARRGEARMFVFMRDEVKHVRLFSCETR